MLIIMMRCFSPYNQKNHLSFTIYLCRGSTYLDFSFVTVVYFKIHQVFLVLLQFWSVLTLMDEKSYVAFKKILGSS